MTDLSLQHAQPDRSEGWLDNLAFEVALRYHSPEELQNRHDISEDQYNRLLQHPGFRRAVDAYRREIDEQGKHFTIKARRMASEVLDVFFEIAGDESAPTADRISAAKALCQYAGIETADKNVGNDGFQVNIQINQGG